MSVSSDELNFLIYRYLQESGFLHSAFTFGNESLITRSNLIGTELPVGSLIKFVQKGLQYTEIEAHVAEDGSEVKCTESFSLIAPHVCHITPPEPDSIPMDLAEAKQSPSGAAPPTPHSALAHSGLGLPAAPSQTHPAPSPPATATPLATSEAHPTTPPAPMSSPPTQPAAQPPPVQSVQALAQQASAGGAPGGVVVLEGHTSEVFICQWNPVMPILATGSGDSTARLWDFGPGRHAPAVLNHFTSTSEKSRDVTTLDWNSEGTSLATGSYDGQARIWALNGDLLRTLTAHRGPIFSLKWNKKGDLLLSGSVDKTAIIWDVATGRVRQQFDFHRAPTLDVDWRNNTSFATCSTDMMIFVCKLGEPRPIKAFTGHTNEVNAVKWDPTGNLLASCSDDGTAKIWTTRQDRCLHDFREHSKEIYTIKWSPTGPSTSNPNLPLCLGTASFDATVKLWDPEAGRLHTLSKHTDPVYSIAFSPNGQYIASGSFDRHLHIWSVRDGALVRSYQGMGGIFEVCWNPAGDRVAACWSDNTVSVLDFRM
ncbi:putative transducin family protein / WD-40 repeat family protein [Paratrimastix pyriformis]|uniref:Transducin family protein / WD-40 repeat family protein n=1 Tax=Paratrimastix pyriformis TaxID=342808 RepID=A0ABQ8UMS8_9EUKA|nr:putative transducin family protein / WD-40 repeat family protein [Paratrimastix pyriformis]